MTEFSFPSRRRRLISAALFLVVIGVPTTAWAYVGPGAGIAFMTTALVLVSTIAIAVFGTVFWPVRWVWRAATTKSPPDTPKVKRAVIVGLDGLDPGLVRKFFDQGKLPNLKRLADLGTFEELETTYPAMSPVAWSSFSTGVNPGKHGIYDFLTRDPRNYAPDLSSADVGPPSRHLPLGKYRIPIGKPRLRLLRKSRPFWQALSKYRIPASILRVPITFPPDRFEGTMLSAMCVPDLKGTQGTFTYYAAVHDHDDAERGDAPDDDPYAGGSCIPVEVIDGEVKATFQGPPNPIRTDGEMLSLPFEIRLEKGIAGEGTDGELIIDDSVYPLTVGEYTDWAEIAFPMGLGLKLRGMCRFRLLSLDPFRLYVTPINIDPSRPVLPISHPRFFSVFLAKLIGRFTTLGLAEDTWALNEGVLDDDAFLEQAWSNHEERERMFFEMLKRTPKGLVTCVFDGTDRIQHMFMRYEDDAHPAVSDEDRDSYKHVIEETYTRCDRMLGRVFEEVDPEDPKNLLVVMSDHGFASFRRGVNLNSWLYRNGYLHLQGDEEDDDKTMTSREWFRGVDWTRTRAFALGLGGIFLNVKGREAQGIVEPGEEARELARELAEKLEGLVDPKNEEVAIQKMYLAEEIYDGPYVDEAPHLIVGYSKGWRASWDGARGMVSEVVFDDNTKAWSGDHCIDPTVVPGVIFSNRKLAEMEDGRRAAIIDVAPTVLKAFGIPRPRYMDGQPLPLDL